MRSTLFRTALPTNSHTRPRLVLGAMCLVLLSACGSTTASTGSGHPSPTASPSGAMDAMGMSGGKHHGDPGKGLLSTEDGYTLKPPAQALALGRQTLRFQIVDRQGAQQTNYVPDQTKLLHFYLVREDLTGYQHLHPVLVDGTWSVDVNVAQPGPYRMYTDFIAQDNGGAEHPVVLSVPLTADGPYQPTARPTASSTATADGLTATMTGTLSAGAENKVTVVVTDAAGPVEDLQQYLDSFAHMTAIHAGDLAYQHVHPDLTARPGQLGGLNLPFSVELPEAGTWQLFLQVQRTGTLHLLPLTVQVS